MKVTGIIPMRMGSRRLKDKNLLSLGGVAMWRTVYQSMAMAKSVERIIWTVCPWDGLKEWGMEMRVLAEVAERDWGVDTQVLHQPKELCADNKTAHDFLKFVDNAAQDEVYVFTHICNPFTKPETIDKAVRRFREHGAYDSVIGVVPLQQKLWKANLDAAQMEPMNHDPLNMLPTQDLQKIYQESCSLYVFAGKQLRDTGSHHGKAPIPFVLDPIEGWDIDYPWEYEVAEAIWEKRNHPHSHTQ
ncbi:hypothetical protein LCGC14_2007880 [marine sediment metagenome]|uniref:Cytidylyltransferase n=1 Tax=marine sediment metagenome TaxID=412755 RepID=A0A0F9HEI5_9ZZZZ